MLQNEDNSRSSKTILVADRESVVRDVASAILRAGGYNTIQATSIEAIHETLREHAGSISLLLLDPAMLCRKARTLHDVLPEMDKLPALVLSTDYSKQDALGEYALPPSDRVSISGYIQKPYTAGDLRMTVDLVLLNRSLANS